MTDNIKIYITIQLIGFLALFTLVLRYWYNEIYRKI